MGVFSHFLKAFPFKYRFEQSADGASYAPYTALEVSGSPVSNGNPLPVSASVSISNAAQETGGNLAAAATAIGTPADTSASSDSGSFSLIAFVKRSLANWTTLLAKIPSLGASTSAGSVPVALSTDGIFAVNFGAKANSTAASDSASASHISLLKRLLGKTGRPDVTLADGSFVRQVASDGVRWVDDFGLNAAGNNAIDSNLWDIFDGGVYSGGTANTGASGSGVTMGGYSVANSTLLVNMGTTANAELHLLSKQVFTVPCDVFVSLKLSQAIANNSVYVELVEVDSNGNPVAHPTLNESNNRLSAIFGGATGSTSTLETLGRASPNGAQNVSAVNFTNWTSDADFTLEARHDDAWLFGVPMDTNTVKASVSARLSRQVIDPNKQYKLRIRFKNGATPPGSATTVTIYRVAGIAIQELTVQVAGGRGDVTGGHSVGVNVSNTPSINGANADNSATVGNPVMIGGVMSNAAGGIAAGTNGNQGRVQLDLARRMIMQPIGHPSSHLSARLSAITAATEQTLLAAQGSTLRTLLQSLIVVNHNSAALILDIRDAAAGTIRETVRVPATDTRQITFPAGRAATALNAAWTVQARSAPATGYDVAGSFYSTTA